MVLFSPSRSTIAWMRWRGSMPKICTTEWLYMGHRLCDTAILAVRCMRILRMRQLGSQPLRHIRAYNRMWVLSLPLDGGWWFIREIEEHHVDARAREEAGGDLLQNSRRGRRGVRGHGFLRFHGTERDRLPASRGPERQEHDRELPDFFIEAGPAHLLVHERVRFAEQVRPRAGDKSGGGDDLRWLGVGQAEDDAVHFLIAVRYFRRDPPMLFHRYFCRVKKCDRATIRPPVPLHADGSNGKENGRAWE